MLKRFIVILTIFISLDSCHPFICSWNSGYEQLIELPDNNVIRGNYRLTKNSLDFLKTKGYTENCELKVLDSSRFELINAPDLMLSSFEKDNASIINKTGKWSVVCGESFDCMFELEGIVVAPIARKNNGSISILITIGDGDECNGIIFEKEK
jgi:hypothetical protein